MKRISLQDRVLNYLKENGSITSWEAIREFGATRLSAIIYNLRYKEGLNIITKNINDKNRYGDPVSYARYYLEEK
jgi:hypothetical protein